jgi:hypothetical protein
MPRNSPGTMHRNLPCSADPAHWSARYKPLHNTEADLVMDIGGGLDDLAERAGADNGLALVLKITGVGEDVLDSATRAEWRSWYFACHEQVIRDRPASIWDVVAYSSMGIRSHEAGWTG